jgi:hypothetical protein
MTRLPLSCPQCKKPLVYVPLDGLTLHYRCVVHGVVIMRPLLVVAPEDELTAAAETTHHQLASCDAA